MRKKKIYIKRSCYFCINNRAQISFQDANLLKKFVSSYMKIAPRRRSGLCAGHQRQVANAIKRAREMSLMPYIPY